MRIVKWSFVLIVAVFAMLVNAQNKVAVIPLAGEDAIPSRYQELDGLTTGPQDILTGLDKPLGIPFGPTMFFTKQFDDTTIEAYLLSAARTESISLEVPQPFVRFWVLVNGLAPTYGNQAGLTNNRKEDHLSALTVYQGLPKGKYKIRTYVHTNSIALGVELDPDNIGGKIIVKEVQ